jgi:hypothetical protein
MYSFRKSLAALVGLFVIVVTATALVPLVGRGQGGGVNPLNRDPRKSYYLTQTRHTGAQALTACAAGYHMASVWEIHDPSNLRYDTQLGVTLDDSGFGPPSGDFSVDLASLPPAGWVRTGGRASSELFPSRANCLAWTSDSDADFGAFVFLPDNWNSQSSPVTVGSPWTRSALRCGQMTSVWCVQD